MPFFIRYCSGGGGSRLRFTLGTECMMGTIIRIVHVEQATVEVATTALYLIQYHAMRYANEA
jgi:hypothetical protein